jgi:glycosyltransferase involved in cell wall biosynthesis
VATAGENAGPKKAVSFTVVTAAYNAEATLPGLIRSLQDQIDSDFEWVVADGGSTDGTLSLLREASCKLPLQLDTRADFGIYDALNRAVSMARGDYYLVVGADDQLNPDAIAKYKQACESSGADLVTAKIDIGGQIVAPRKRREWLYGMAAHVSGHSVGLAIRRSLHDCLGLYSRKFPITADQLFVLNAIHAGAKVHECDFVAGRFGTEGASGGDPFGTLIEYFRTQVVVGHSLWAQLVLVVSRLVRHPAIYRPRRPSKP